MIAMIVRILMIVAIVTIVLTVMIAMILMIVKIVKNGVDCCGVVTCRMLPAAHPGSSEGYNIF